MLDLHLYALPSLVTVAALLLYTYVSFNVGKARGTYGIKAPATVGNEQFERIYRVQMNTLEQLVSFLPSLWLFAFYVSAPAAAGIGIFWVIGRIMYNLDYQKDPAKRGRGFMLGMLSSMILLLGVAISAVMKVIL